MSFKLNNVLHTHYVNLSIARDASAEIIKASYKALLEKYDEAKYSVHKEQLEAARIRDVLKKSSEILLSPQMRAAHDAWISEQENLAKPYVQPQAQALKPDGSLSASSMVQKEGLAALSENERENIAELWKVRAGPPRPTERDQMNTSQPSRIWLSVLTVVCLGILVYGYMYSKNAIGNVAFLFGQNLVFGFFIWGIFHMALGRKQNQMKAVLSFLFILGSLMASSLIGYSQQKLAATQVITEIQKDYSAIYSSGSDAQGLPQRIEKQLDTTPTTKGEFGEMERFMKTFMNQVVSQRNDYLLELDAIGWGKILDPKRVNEDKTLIESKMMIQKAKDIVGKYKAKTFTLLEDARKDLGTLNISENSRREMVNGFDRGMAGAQIDELWNLETKTVSEFEKIFTLLSAKKDAWIVQNGQIMFASEDDLSTFNSYLASIQDLVSKEEAIQKQNFQAVDSNFNNLKN